MRDKLLLFSGFFLILLFPSQTELHFWPHFSLLNGLRIDYLSPVLRITDLLGLIFVFLAKPRLSAKFLLLPIINIVFAPVWPTTFFSWLRIGLYFAIYKSFLLYFHRYRKYWLYAFYLSLVWVSSLSLLQILSGGNLGNLWYWLGERNLSTSLPYIAKIYLPFVGYLLRPYATFPHPNALGGYMLISFLLLSARPVAYLRCYLFRWAQISSFITVLFSFSRTAIFAVLTCLFPASVILTLPLFVSSIIVSPSSLSERLFQYHNYLPIVGDRLLSGLGLGYYPMASAINTISSPLPSTIQIAYQPIHNVFLLLIAELGLPMFILIVAVFYKKILRPLLPNHPWIYVALLITGLIDHYWLTSKSNLLLLAFVFALLKSSRVPNQTDS